MMQSNIYEIAETLAYGSHMRVLSESLPLNTQNDSVYMVFKIVGFSALYKSGLTIKRVKVFDLFTILYPPWSI